MAEYILAHDIGTSGNKATLFHVNGTLVTSYVCSYDVNYFGKNCAEQNPDVWWNAVCESTKRVLEGINKKDVLAVSFSAQMQCCLPVDRNGNVLRNAMIWADQRAVEEAEFLKKEIGFDTMYQITGHRVSPSYTLEKLMWIKKNEPDIYKKIYKTLQVKDYIIYRLTNQFVTDYSDASGTNALDLDRLSWSKEILGVAKIDENIFPDLHQSIEQVGTVTKEAALSTGLMEGTPIICGGGDGPCSAVGAGCIKDKELFMTFGTSAWIGGTTKEKFLDDDKVLFCFAHVIPKHYMPCGTMQGAGSSYSYIRKLLQPNCSYEELNKMIERSPAGAKELLFLPYMLGERSPRWNEKTTGAFLGMKMYHKQEDYLRAVIEGIGYNLELILQSYRKYFHIDQMKITGGGAKGETICKILANILECTLYTPRYIEEATSIAATVMAGIGVGVYKDFEAISTFQDIQSSYVNDMRDREIYTKLKNVFDASYYALEPIFEMLSK